MSFFSSAKNFSRFCNSLRYNYSSLSLTRPTISLPDAHPFSAAHFRGYAAKPATAAKKPWMKRDETVRTEPTVETTVEEVLDEESAIRYTNLASFGAEHHINQSQWYPQNHYRPPSQTACVAPESKPSEETLNTDKADCRKLAITEKCFDQKVRKRGLESAQEAISRCNGRNPRPERSVSRTIHHSGTRCQI